MQESIYINNYDRDSVMKIIRENNKGYRAVKTNGSCRYLTDDDNKCLVGCFIPSKLYEDGMEDKNSTVLLNNYGHLHDFMPLKTDKLRNLQIFHDDSFAYNTPESFYSMIEQKLIELEGLDAG